MVNQLGRSTVNIDRILLLRGEAFAALRFHAAELLAVGHAVEMLDEALHTAVSERGIDTQCSLIEAERALAAILGAASAGSVL